EDHINEGITLHSLADTAGYSPWYSARIFKECTGESPFEYIRKMRLSYAANRLKNESEKIVDVAFDFVFGSHETFTRAFSKQFGMTPRSYKKNKPDLKLFLPENIRNYYYASLQKGVNDMSKKGKTNTVFIQVVDRPKRKLILKRGVKAKHYFEYCDEVGCEVWDILSGIKEALYEPIGMWLPDSLRKPGTSTYAQGVEVPVDYNSKIPEGFELIELPPCKMMVFQGEPYEDEKFEDAISEIWEVIKDFNPKLYGFSWAVDDGPRFQLVPLGYRGYIEAKPVRQIVEK
ncbi:AraC family transcriptional regulator, partial [Actinomycetota bacterium]